MGKTMNTVYSTTRPKANKEAIVDLELRDGRKRGGPWVAWLNINTPKRISIVEPDGPRRMTLAWGFSYNLPKVSLKRKETSAFPAWCFVVVGFS